MSGSTAVETVKNDLADKLIAAISGLAVLFLVTVFFLLALSKNLAGTRDFVAYWASGQQLVHHANPYNLKELLQLEKGAGLRADTPVLAMRNPPWALPLTLPLGWMNARWACLLWYLVSLGCLLGSVRMLWQMQGSPPSHLHWLGVSFAPALFCLMIGQTTLLALFGFVLFVYLQPTRPFLAGASLWLCMLKPHLFLLFGMVLLVWMVRTRNYRVFLGGFSALALSCLLTEWSDPHAWNDYAEMMQTTGATSEHVPCLSVWLCGLIRPAGLGMTYLPTVLAGLWALGYYWWRRKDWQWQTHGPLLLLVGVLTSPYAWMYDDTLALPAILRGAYRTRLRWLLAWIAVLSFVVEGEMFLMPDLGTWHFLWTAPAWLLWYLAACRWSNSNATRSHIVAPTNAEIILPL